MQNFEISICSTSDETDSKNFNTVIASNRKMNSQDKMSVPAWKKLGLKVKVTEPESENVLSVTHLENSTVTNKQAKKLKRKAEAASLNTADKKPPKRVKVPKSERKPPPEKDQLVYLRQYHNDRDNWKFSKQKQNWILKNIRNIPEEFEEALISYVEGIQGGSRDRLVEDLKKVVEKWNDLQAVAEAKVMAQLEKKKNGAAEKEEKKDAKDTETSNKKKIVSVQEEEAPDVNHAKKCRLLIKALTGEVVEVNGVEDDESEDEEAPEESLSKVPEVPQVDEEEVEKLEQETQREAAHIEEAENEEEVEDNLIIDNVEVSGYPEEFQNALQGSKAEQETKKFKSKKSKSKKKSKKSSA